MLIAFWAGSVFLAWAGLVGGWFVAKSKLSRIDQRIALDIQALDVAHELESDVLKDRYNDLLWKATGQSMYRQKREESLHAAEQIAADLRRYITTDQEREVSARIEREMNTLRKQSESGALRRPRASRCWRICFRPHASSTSRTRRTCRNLSTPPTIWTET